MIPERLGAPRLRAALEAAESWLAANRDGINSINVYPVPDGDTGTNMLLTLRSALRDTPHDLSTSGDVTASIARAALLGARGNSGVIWSQMLRGFAEATAGLEAIPTVDLIPAMEQASRAAYASVTQPVEGTMLTVLREAAEAGRHALDTGGDIETVLRATVTEAYASLQRTPDLLPRLREAGVVDSGGAGVAVLIEGFVLAVLGETPPTTPRFTATEQVAVEALEHEGHGYCTEFISTVDPASGRTIDRVAMEQALLGLGGESVLVVGDEHTVHVHAHLADPGPAISLGAAAGALLTVKVEDMDAQHRGWLDGHAPPRGDAPRDLPAVGLVAVARGAGIVRAFLDLGATGIIEAAEGSKASAGELLSACRGAATEHVLLLPNDKDVLMAAEACAREAPGFVTVVPTRNVATGLAAAVAFPPAARTEHVARIADSMTEAAAAVRSVEVSVAVRDATVDEVPVTRGAAITFVDGRLVSAVATIEEALLAGLDRAIGEQAEIVTVYLGQGAPRDATTRLGLLIEAAHPGLAVDVIEGGQPHYPYIAAVE